MYLSFSFKLPVCHDSFGICRSWHAFGAIKRDFWQLVAMMAPSECGTSPRSSIHCNKRVCSTSCKWILYGSRYWIRAVIVQDHEKNQPCNVSCTDILSFFLWGCCCPYSMGRKLNSLKLKAELKYQADTVSLPVMLTFSVNIVTCVTLIVKISCYPLYSQMKCLLLKQEHTKGLPPASSKIEVTLHWGQNMHPGSVIALILLLLKSVKTVPVMYDLKGNKTYQWSPYSYPRQTLK